MLLQSVELTGDDSSDARTRRGVISRLFNIFLSNPSYANEIRAKKSVLLAAGVAIERLSTLLEHFPPISKEATRIFMHLR